MKAPISIPQRVLLMRLAVCAGEGISEWQLMNVREPRDNSKHVLWHLINDQLGFMGQAWVSKQAGYSSHITSDIFSSARLQERCAAALRIYKQYLWDARQGRMPKAVSADLNWFEKARISAGLTRQQLGEKIGVTRWAVERWERAGKRPSASRRGAIESALGVPVPDELLYVKNS